MKTPDAYWAWWEAAVKVDKQDFRSRIEKIYRIVSSAHPRQSKSQSIYALLQPHYLDEVLVLPDDLMSLVHLEAPNPTLKDVDRLLLSRVPDSDRAVCLAGLVAIPPKTELKVETWLSNAWPHRPMDSEQPPANAAG